MCKIIRETKLRILVQGDSVGKYFVHKVNHTCECRAFEFHNVDKDGFCKHLKFVKDKLIFEDKEFKGWSKKGKHSRESVNELLSLLYLYFKKLRLQDNYDVCGSYRRGKSEIGDVDIIVMCRNDLYEKLINTLISELNNIEVLSRGNIKCSLLMYNIQVDLRHVNKSQWTTMLLHTTGPSISNIKLRSIAKRKGMKLNEYGLYDRETNKRIRVNSESAIYKRLGLEYIEPKDR